MAVRDIKFNIAAVDAASATLKEVGKGLGNLGKDVDQSQGKLSKLGKSIASVGAIAGGAALAGVTAFGAGIAGTIAAGVKEASKLDTAMADIAAVMGKTKDEVLPLKAAIQELAVDPNLKVSATEAASAVELLARNGLQMEDILNGAARATVALANATGADFGVAADIATDAMAQFGIEVEDLEGVIDSITGVVTNSKFDINDMGLALAQAGGIAGEMGVEFNDFAAVIAGTASSFKSGSDAGTSFKTFLQRLADPTNEIIELTDQLGIALFDAEGNMNSMETIVDQLNSAFSTMTEEEKARTAAILGGADAARTVLALAGMTKDEFASLSEAVNESGQAFAAAATRTDSLEGSMEILRSVIQGNLIQIGDKFLPVLNKLVKTFTGIVSENGPAMIGFFETIADIIDQAIPTIERLADAFAEEGLAGVMGEVGTIVSELATTLTNAWPTIQAALVEWGNKFWNWITDTAVPAAAGMLQQIVDTVSQFVTDNWPIVRDALVEWGNKFWNWITTAQENGPAMLQGLVNTVAQFITDNWPTVQAALAEWGNKFIGEVVGPAVAGIPDALTQIVSAVASWISENVPTIQDAVAVWSDAILSWVGVAVSGIAAALGTLIAAAAAWVTSEEGQGAMLDLGNSLGQAIVNGIENLLSSSENSTGMLTQLAGALLAGVAAVTGILITIGATIVAGIIDGILDALGIDLEPATIGELTSVLSGIGENIKTIANVIGTNIVDGIVKGLRNAQQALNDGLINPVKDGIAKLKSFLGIGSPSTVFEGFGKDLMQGLINGITSLKNSVLGTISDVSSGLFEKGKSLVGGLFGGGEEEAPKIDVSGIGEFDFSSVAVGASDLQNQIINIQNRIKEIFELTLPQFRDTFVEVTEVFVERLLAVLAELSAINLLFITMTEVTLVNFQTKAVEVLTAINTQLLTVNATLQVMIGLLRTISQEFDKVAESAKKTIEEMLKVDKAISELKKLKEIVEQAAKAFEKLKAAAEAAAKAARSAGAASGEGGGPSFQSGTHGRFMTVPGPIGSPFPITLHGGEEFLVRTAGEAGRGSGDTTSQDNRQQNFNLTIHTNSPVEPIAQDFLMMRALASRT